MGMLTDKVVIMIMVMVTVMVVMIMVVIMDRVVVTGMVVMDIVMVTGMVIKVKTNQLTDIMVRATDIMVKTTDKAKTNHTTDTVQVLLKILMDTQLQSQRQLFKKKIFME
jgi:hypothetical protein